MNEKRGHTRGGRDAEMQTGGIFDDVAGGLDHLAGSTDEALGRTFDDSKGGGLLDGFQQTVPLISQGQSVTERQVEEGILEEGAAEPPYVSQSSASIQASDNEAPPGGPATQIISVSNGIANVPSDNPNRRSTDAQDVISPEGAVIGIGSAAVGAVAAGASVGSFVGPVGTVVGGAAAGVGSLLASEVEEFVGALGYTITGAIDGEPVGQTVTSVGVPAAGVGTNSKDVELQHSVPQEPGDYTLNVVVSMWQTGEVINSMEIPITVEEGAAENTASANQESSATTFDPLSSGGEVSGGGGGAGSTGSRLQWVIDNPVIALGGGVAGLVVLRTATEGAITGE